MYHIVLCLCCVKFKYSWFNCLLESNQTVVLSITYNFPQQKFKEVNIQDTTALLSVSQVIA